MKSYRLTILFIACLATINTFAQKGAIEKAEKAYHDFGYIKTTEILQSVAENGYKSVELFEKLGNAYYFNNKMTEAVKWYGKLMQMELYDDLMQSNSVIDPEYYFRYAQALKSVENYEESNKWMKRFHDSKTDDSRGQHFLRR